MTDDADRFDAAYDALPRVPEAQPGDTLAHRLALALEVGAAVSSYPLSRDERAQLYERVLAIAQSHAQPSWRVRVHPHRRSAVVGGAALMTALAAVGVAMVRERRHHGMGAAA